MFLLIEYEAILPPLPAITYIPLTIVDAYVGTFPITEPSFIWLKVPVGISKVETTLSIPEKYKIESKRLAIVNMAL